MRLWSIHPRYLDTKGLVALWREGLLARAVLDGRTRGYQRHPQLERFRAHPQPLAALDAYLGAVVDESRLRGYRFDASKLGPMTAVEPIEVASGQLALEWRHLRGKLAARSPDVLARWADLVAPDCHPLFRCVPGPVATWERATQDPD